MAATSAYSESPADVSMCYRVTNDIHGVTQTQPGKYYQLPRHHIAGLVVSMRLYPHNCEDDLPGIVSVMLEVHGGEALARGVDLQFAFWFPETGHRPRPFISHRFTERGTWGFRKFMPTSVLEDQLDGEGAVVIACTIRPIATSSLSGVIAQRCGAVSANVEAANLCPEVPGGY